MTRRRGRGGRWWLAFCAGWIGPGESGLGPDPDPSSCRRPSRSPCARWTSRAAVTRLPLRRTRLARRRAAPTGRPAVARPRRPSSGSRPAKACPSPTVRVFAASGEPWRWAQRAVEEAGGAHRRDRRAAGDRSVDVRAGRRRAPARSTSISRCARLSPRGAAPSSVRGCCRRRGPPRSSSARGRRLPLLRRVHPHPAPSPARHRRGRARRRADVGDVQPQPRRRHLRTGGRQPAAGCASTRRFRAARRSRRAASYCTVSSFDFEDQRGVAGNRRAAAGGAVAKVRRNHHADAGLRRACPTRRGRSRR